MSAKLHMEPDAGANAPDESRYPERLSAGYCISRRAERATRDPSPIRLLIRGNKQRRLHLLHAWSGSAGVDAVVTALVLAGSRASVSDPSNGRTEPVGMRSVRGSDEKESRHAWRLRPYGELNTAYPARVTALVETCLCHRTGIFAPAAAVSECADSEPSFAKRGAGARATCDGTTRPRNYRRRLRSRAHQPRRGLGRRLYAGTGDGGQATDPDATIQAPTNSTN